MATVWVTEWRGAGKELCVLNLGEEKFRKRGWACALVHFPSEADSLCELFSREWIPGKVETRRIKSRQFTLYYFIYC